MEKYIDQIVAIDTILSNPPDAHYPVWFAEQIGNLPPADVVEVAHGYWYNINHYQDYAFATCSICKASGTLRTKRNDWGIWYIHSPYCPNCGAKMNGGK